MALNYYIKGSGFKNQVFRFSTSFLQGTRRGYKDGTGELQFTPPPPPSPPPPYTLTSGPVLLYMYAFPIFMFATPTWLKSWLLT